MDLSIRSSGPGWQSRSAVGIRFDAPSRLHDPSLPVPDLQRQQPLDPPRGVLDGQRPDRCLPRRASLPVGSRCSAASPAPPAATPRSRSTRSSRRPSDPHPSPRPGSVGRSRRASIPGRSSAALPSRRCHCSTDRSIASGVRPFMVRFGWGATRRDLAGLPGEPGGGVEDRGDEFLVVDEVDDRTVIRRRIPPGGR